MISEPDRLRLTRISTQWTLVFEAHEANADRSATAYRQLIERYAGAIYRYLLGATRDEDVADELFQEFAVRFVRGSFARADPNRGRFRHYLKTALSHLVSDYRRRQNRCRPLEETAELADISDSDSEAFCSGWRDELIARAWESLARIEKSGKQPLYTLLKFHSENPQLGSVELARRINGMLELPKPISPVYARKLLQRARARLTDLILDEVAFSLGGATLEEVEDELAEIGLLHYCGAALARRQES